MFPFRIVYISFHTIQACALANFNWHLSDKRGYATAWREMTMDSPQWRLDRITVNFIRHELTDYDALVAEVLRGGEGQDGVDRLRHAVLVTIEETYPQLAGECERQMRMVGHRVGSVMRTVGR
jgi:hypothetical protein